MGVVVLGLSSFEGDIRWEKAWEWRELFLRGLLMTAAVSLGGLVLGLAVGVAAALARLSRSVWLRETAFVYVEVIRGTPWLVQLYVWYFCLAKLLELGVITGDAEAVVVGVLGLGVFAGAYTAEIVRAGVESIGRGQWEAARSLGLSHRQALFRIVLPQSVRRMIPPMTGEAVSLIKESALLSVISVREVTYHAKNMAADTYESFAAYIPLACLYLCLTLPLSALSRALERRLEGPRAVPVSEL